MRQTFLQYFAKQILCTLLGFLLIISGLSAQAQTAEDQVQRSYIAFYGRPADAAGLVFWSDQLDSVNGDLAEILDDFSNSQEFLDRYGSLSDEDLISSLYQQLFNRDPDAEGLSFYAGELQSGARTLDSIALDVLNGALNSDLAIIDNKQAAAVYFTEEVTASSFVYSGDTAAEEAKAMLSSIGADTTDFSSLVDTFFATYDTAETNGSTNGVLCDYSDSTFNTQDSLTYTSESEWTCTETTRELVANGIPDHDVGTFPNQNNPNTITEQSVSASYTLEPTETTSTTVLGGPSGETGFVLNGVKIDAGTAGSCDDSGDSCSLIGNSGSWSIEALGQSSFNFGTDDNNAHVQPGGSYHYHGMPEGFITKQGGNSSTMTLIGWAADGFPIYARYGYSIAGDASSELKSITGSYQLISDVSDSRPSATTYPLGTFSQDWEYVEGSGDLDECNGRVGVTPEFPGGIYHYYATDSYPYLQRCVRGAVETNGTMPPPPQ